MRRRTREFQSFKGSCGKRCRRSVEPALVIAQVGAGQRTNGAEGGVESPDRRQGLTAASRKGSASSRRRQRDWTA